MASTFTSPSTEAHLTLVYGDSVYACAAAINGAVLSQLDPQRARIAFVWAASEATLRIIAHSWRVVRITPPGAEHGLDPSDAPARKLPLLDARLPARCPTGLAQRGGRDGAPCHSGIEELQPPAPQSGGRLSRAIYWDVDHMVLPTGSALAVERLWNFSPGAKMVALPERAGCFNGGAHSLASVPCPATP
jgi:hypothetical protein|eukprot:7385611-Prymnesium_polylepis.3